MQGYENHMLIFFISHTAVIHIFCPYISCTQYKFYYCMSEAIKFKRMFYTNFNTSAVPI